MFLGKDVLKICSKFTVDLPCPSAISIKLLCDYMLSFIPARRDPSFVLPGSRFAGMKFYHVIASARLKWMKKLIKKISIEVHFNRSKIFLCFCDAYDVNLWEKKASKRLCKISSFYRGSHRRCSAKKVFLKILQYPQESTCVRVSLQALGFAILLIRDTNTYVFL